MIGNPKLGKGVHNVAITTSCSDAAMSYFTSSRIAGIKYNMILDSVSAATVTIAGSDCSDILRGIDLGQRYLSIERNDVVVFHGPITRLELMESEIVLFAHDPLWWASRRVFVPSDKTEYPTPVHMFEEIVLAGINDPNITEENVRDKTCTLDFPPLCFQDTYRIPGGDVALAPDRKSKLNTVLDALATSTIDYTVVGRTLLYGYTEVPIPATRLQVPPLLTNSSWVSAPKITFDLTAIVNDVFIQSSRPDYRKTVCGGTYGFHQDVLDLPEITDDLSLVEAADSYLSQSNSAAFLENLSGTALSPDVAWDVPRMVPGMVLPLDVTMQGINLVGDMRLNEAIVDVDSDGDETVKVSLEPVGLT